MFNFSFSLFPLLLLISLLPLKVNSEGSLSVRPFTVHFFYDTYSKNLTQEEKETYMQLLKNPLISKDQALRKVDSIAHEKGQGFEKTYLKWKKAQEKHNIEWWQVNDVRMVRTSKEAQNLYESIKAIHFNKTLSFHEDCTAYNQLIQRAKKSIQKELEWDTLNCTIVYPELNPHGRLAFKLIL